MGPQMIWRMHTLAPCFLYVHTRYIRGRVTAVNLKGKASGWSWFGIGLLVV